MVKTIKLQGKDYAQVVERVKEFRKDCPYGKIETSPLIQEDGQIIFKATVIKDKSDESSAEATGHALGNNKSQKSFEKLETIAVGRALAMLGYASDGEIASGDEMEEYIKYTEDKKKEKLVNATEKLEDTTNIAELKDVWGNLPSDLKDLLGELKNKLKLKYESK